MHSIPGYTLLETIIAGQKVKLYRAITVSDGKKVLLKIDQRGDKAAARCSHELAMAGGLTFRCLPALKLEYCGDIPFWSWKTGECSCSSTRSRSPTSRNSSPSPGAWRLLLAPCTAII